MPSHNPSSLTSRPAARSAARATARRLSTTWIVAPSSNILHSAPLHRHVEPVLPDIRQRRRDDSPQRRHASAPFVQLQHHGTARVLCRDVHCLLCGLLLCLCALLVCCSRGVGCRSVHAARRDSRAGILCCTCGLLHTRPSLAGGLVIRTAINKGGKPWSKSCFVRSSKGCCSSSTIRCPDAESREASFPCLPYENEDPRETAQLPHRAEHAVAADQKL